MIIGSLILTQGREAAMAQSFFIFFVLGSLRSFLLATRFYPQNLIVAEVLGVVNSIPLSKTVLRAKANFRLDKRSNIYYHRLDLI